MKNKLASASKPSSNSYNVLPSPTTKALLSGSKSFDWIAFLTESGDDVDCVSVSSFKHAPMSELWDDLVTISLKVEVRNTDHSSNEGETEGYWISSVIRFAGYYVQLRYEGFGSDSSKDFWLNIFTSDIHPVGWCASQGKILIPPASVESHSNDWKGFLLKRLTGSRTLPENFLDQLKDCAKSRFMVGMRLEVIDKSRISAVRVATVDSIIGGRLHIKYESGQEEEPDTGFWCHQFSPLIHPVGWAQLVGHELKATEEYAKDSLRRAMNNEFDANDAAWTLFPPVKLNPQPALVNSTSQHLNTHQNGLGFQEGMKLEAIDPLNLSTICVATVMKVLRSNYLMIGIDGMMSDDGSDWFCYHATSPCIFPVGFCKKNGIDLTPPKDCENFDWDAYLEETKSIAAPVVLFKKETPSHSFKEGHYLEAVDLMEPRLVCVAQVKKVVGRLLRIHFNGWGDTYDQWCDCESPELFPVGWCHLVGYPLEPPRDEDKSDTSKKLKRPQKGKKGKKGKLTSKSDTSVTFLGDDDMEVDSGHDSTPKTSKHVMHNRATDPVKESPVKEAVPEAKAGHSRKMNRWPKPKSYTRPTVSNLSNSEVVVKPSPAQPVLPCQRSRDPDPSKWNVADVAYFLENHDHANYVQSFVQKVCVCLIRICFRSQEMMNPFPLFYATSFEDFIWSEYVSHQIF